ncbi:MAG: hypothetical protein ACTHLW_16910, partial [Verrucomicrobiota bacterium]
HPQPLAVSYLPYLAGASLSWCGKTFQERLLVPVLSRDVFSDPTQRAAKAAAALGLLHRKLRYAEPNVTPLGAVIAAPPKEQRELFCRNGLKYYARIPARRIQAASKSIQKERGLLHRSRPQTTTGKLLVRELDLAARMAQGSCQFMLWQQALAAGDNSTEQRLASVGMRALRRLEKAFNAYWPLRNKATPGKCSAFLKWRLEDYRRRTLAYPPTAAAKP